MKQTYYIIGKDQATGELKVTVTNSLTDAEYTRKEWRAHFYDVILLTTWELFTITKPGMCELGETIEISEVDSTRDNTPIGTL